MAQAKPETKAESKKDNNVIVVDVRRKYRRKHIRRLRRGRGKLMNKIEELVADLRDAESLGENVQPVVVVVREKKKRRGINRNFNRMFGF
jgi:hypothetical protein